MAWPRGGENFFFSKTFHPSAKGTGRSWAESHFPCRFSVFLQTPPPSGFPQPLSSLRSSLLLLLLLLLFSGFCFGFFGFLLCVCLFVFVIGVGVVLFFVFVLFVQVKHGCWGWTDQVIRMAKRERHWKVNQEGSPVPMGESSLLRFLAKMKMLSSPVQLYHRDVFKSQESNARWILRGKATERACRGDFVINHCNYDCHLLKGWDVFRDTDF